MKTEKQFSEHFTNALLSFFWNFFVYFLFILPFDLWQKAVIRLSEQKEKGSLEIKKINSSWPFLSFLKSFLIEFIFDGLIFFSYIIGIVMAIMNIINNDGEVSTSALIIIGSYYHPVALSVIRDIFQILILPFRKLINWFNKPPQYLDLNFVNKYLSVNEESVKEAETSLKQKKESEKTSDGNSNLLIHKDTEDKNVSPLIIDDNDL